MTNHVSPQYPPSLRSPSTNLYDQPSPSLNNVKYPQHIQQQQRRQRQQQPQNHTLLFLSLIAYPQQCGICKKMVINNNVNAIIINKTHYHLDCYDEQLYVNFTNDLQHQQQQQQQKQQNHYGHQNTTDYFDSNGIMNSLNEMSHTNDNINDRQSSQHFNNQQQQQQQHYIPSQQWMHNRVAQWVVPNLGGLS